MNLNEYLVFLKEQVSQKIGKIALLEGISFDDKVNVILIFESSGGVYDFLIEGISKISEIKNGQSKGISTDDRSTLSFEEAVKSREQGKKAKIGKYTGSGNFKYVDGTDLKFTCNIFSGEWEIGNVKRKMMITKLS